MLKKIIIPILLILIVASGLYIYTTQINKKDDNMTAFNLDNISASNTNINTTFYYFDSGRSLADITNELKSITQDGLFPIQQLKFEVFNIDENGKLIQQGWFNQEFLSLFKLYAKNVIPMVKGDKGFTDSGKPSWHILTKTRQAKMDAIFTLMDFINDNNLDSVEIDFEPLRSDIKAMDGGMLSKLDMANYQHFLTDLGQNLNSSKYNLYIAVPAQTTKDTAIDTNNLYNHKDFFKDTQMTKYLKGVTIMTYDLNYGNEFNSVTPIKQYKAALERIKESFTDEIKNKIYIGLNSYGSCKIIGTANPRPLNLDKMKLETNYGNWQNNDGRNDGKDDLFIKDNQEICTMPNQTTMKYKIAVAQQSGFNQFAVWSLNGNNNWVQ
jgi:spore germination protein YaaH